MKLLQACFSGRGEGSSVEGKYSFSHAVVDIPDRQTGLEREEPPPLGIKLGACRTNGHRILSPSVLPSPRSYCRAYRPV